MAGAIIDLDGTVYRGGALLPGAVEGVDTLRDAGFEILFCSNNPIKNGTQYVETLSDHGIAVSPGEACSAGVLTTAYLQDNHADDDILCIGTDGLRDQFRDADLQLTTDPEECDVLVASWTPTFDYGDMQDALDAVDETTTFLGTDPDRTFPMDDGRVVPGSGAVIRSVAAVVGRDPDAYLGKPSEIALEFALDKLGEPAEECLIVGDRLDTDLAMGDRAGMTTVLVLTGVSDRADVSESAIEPDYVIDGLGDIGDVLDSLETVDQ